MKARSLFLVDSLGQDVEVLLPAPAVLHRGVLQPLSVGDGEEADVVPHGVEPGHGEVRGTAAS